LGEDGTGKKLIIGYDANTSNLYIDRRTAGLTNFSQAFPAKMIAPVAVSSDSILDLHIFMDQSSVEVFANHNKTVMSALVYTKNNETGISLFSENEEATVLNFEAWKLKSIWGIIPTANNSINIQENNKVNIYPNPVNDKLYVKTNSNVSEKYIYSIFNVLGEKVVNGLANVHDFETGIDVQYLKSGIYYLRTQNGTNISRNSFIKL
jgi:hypothetical protein